MLLKYNYGVGKVIVIVKLVGVFFSLVYEVIFDIVFCFIDFLVLFDINGNSVFELVVFSCVDLIVEICDSLMGEKFS